MLLLKITKIKYAFQGLSLGDHACLSVAYHLKLPVLTADRQWAKLHIGALIDLIG